MNFMLIVMVLLVLLLIGCSGPLMPTVAEAPYKITWTGITAGTVYCDDYELGSSVVVDGYWEYESNLFDEGYFYIDKLLILDASKVVIEKRVAK